MSEIELDQVTKRYAGGAVAVDRVSLRIHDGEFFVLVGPSGCGKSTLLNLIVGLEDITEGEIRLDGVVINRLDAKDRNMAMVFQSYALYPHMSVRDNIAFPLKLARLSAAEIDRRVSRTAAMLGLDELLERRPRQLSGGQRQRAAMGRALVREPKAFLLDEPLSNLDAQLRQQTRAEIARLQRRVGVTTVYVTHDQTEAMTLGDRIALLREGRIQQVGTPRELYQRPANVFVAQFIGSPAINLLPAVVHEGTLRLPIGDIPLDRLASRARLTDGQALIAGLRPEDFVPRERTSPTRTPDPGFEAEVGLTEWLGPELYLSVIPVWNGEAQPMGSPETPNSLSVRVDPRLTVRSGERIELGFDPGAIQLFDARTERRLDLED